MVWDEAEKRIAHGPLRTDTTVLQVAVARLSGYRWPAEQDAGMELAGEQREWVRRCETLHAFADEDGIVCIPPVRGDEPSAAERIQRLLAAAFGDVWTDGVRLNLRPFMAADLPGGKKGAGFLRAKPNVHWRKDRGREPFREQQRFPWFWRDGEFTGERLNDVHLSIAGRQEVQRRAEARQ